MFARNQRNVYVAAAILVLYAVVPTLAPSAGWVEKSHPYRSSGRFLSRATPTMSALMGILAGTLLILWKLLMRRAEWETDWSRDLGDVAEASEQRDHRAGVIGPERCGARSRHTARSRPHQNVGGARGRYLRRLGYFARGAQVVKKPPRRGSAPRIRRFGSAKTSTKGGLGRVVRGGLASGVPDPVVRRSLRAAARLGSRKSGHTEFKAARRTNGRR